MVRIWTAGALVAAVLCGPATPARAAVGAFEFDGRATVACFGCDSSSGTATLCVTGVANGEVLVPCAAVDVQFTAFEPAGGLLDCWSVGTADGTFSGALNGRFIWTRLGAVAVLSFVGDVNGDGVAAFVAPLGPTTCGQQNVSFRVAGAGQSI
jgi:hypothetical protein